MSLSIRVFGSVESCPPIDEIMEALEEGEFEVTVETEDEEDDWGEIYIYESSVEGTIDVTRYEDEEEILEEIDTLNSALESVPDSPAKKAIRKALATCAVMYAVELPEDAADDDNALLMCMLIGQYLAQKSDGLYSVDGEAFFDDSGEMILEFAEAE